MLFKNIKNLYVSQRVSARIDEQLSALDEAGRYHFGRMYQTGNHVYVLVKNVELDHKVLALPGDDEDIFREVVEDHEALGIYSTCFRCLFTKFRATIGNLLSLPIKIKYHFILLMIKAWRSTCSK